MLYILHGDDTVKLRRRLSEIITDQSKAVFLQSDKSSTQDILASLRTSDMFLESKYTVIEKINKLGKKDLDLIFPELLASANSQTSQVILVSTTELSKIFLSKYKNAQIEVFQIPKLFFTFLDNLNPKSFKQELELLLRMENVEAEQIFYAMIKRVHQLILIKNISSSPELEKMSPWQFSKIRSQSSKWTTLALERLYKKLFEIEVKMKSGGLSLPLKKQLDILIIAELH